MIQDVFARICSINISMIKVGSMEDAAATAIHFSISATGCDFSTITMQSRTSQTKRSPHHDFTSRNLSCTISSIDGVNASVSQNKPDASADSESLSDAAARHAQFLRGQAPLLTLASCSEKHV